MSISVSQRIRKSSEIRRVLVCGKKLNGKYVKIALIPNDMDIPRFGFSIGKSVGSAVTRNLVRRRIQHVLKSNRFNQGFDVVVTAKPACSLTSYTAICKSIQSSLQLLGVIDTSFTRRRSGVQS